MILAEAASNVSVWADFIDVATDPAHILAELTFTLVFDGLVLFLLWGKIIKPRITKAVHQSIDADHNIVHTDQGPRFDSKYTPECHDHDEVPPARSARVGDPTYLNNPWKDKW